MGVNRVAVPSEKYDIVKDEIHKFLADCGQGTSRFGGKTGSLNHWLGTDDWCYYDEWVFDPETEEEMSFNTVFVFRDQRKATEFALRFA